MPKVRKTVRKKVRKNIGINLNERAMHDRYMVLFNEVDEDLDGNMDFPEFLSPRGESGSRLRAIAR